VVQVDQRRGREEKSEVEVVEVLEAVHNKQEKNL
jgi:hypothetical protein